MEDELEGLRRRETELTDEVDRLRAALVDAASETLRPDRDPDRILNRSPVMKVYATTDGTDHAVNPS